MDVRDYPKEIEALSLELAEATSDLAAVREQMEVEQTETLATVLYARGEDGKQLYRNDRARDVAVFRALRESDTYRQYRLMERGCEARKAAIAAKLERLRKEFQLAAIEFEANHLGRRN
ncbi:MAG TPA: hypothetical protein VNO70_05900, partial [Blastocatellia bacterium]|nr:hypothetical protein [Blastocatellia bacterium]